jgi:quinoprotein glucose dehydrogenase
VLQLDTGKAVSGILRSEDKQRAVLVDAEGKEIVVSVAEIEERFEGLSAMPEDLVKQMTSRELRDLVEWLSRQRDVADDNSHSPAGVNDVPTRGAASR